MHPLWTHLLSLPARQQPHWPDPGHTDRVRADLAARPGLVEARDVALLRHHLADVAAGRLLVLQAGDCAEDWAERTAAEVTRKAGLLHALAGVLCMRTGRPVLRVGRIAGQAAKPRSQPTECVAGITLPAYRGHLVNSPEPDSVRRRPDPTRMLAGYRYAWTVMGHLGWPGAADRPGPEAPVWTSHEALLLDYELALLRTVDGRPLLSSTHWPWIGERTRQPDGAHVALLAAVENPVACKVGPGCRPEDVLALCHRLDPHRQPGRLTLIARMGAAAVREALPPLVAAVRAAGHPVVWLCDPMHANTVRGPHGRKTRIVEAVMGEVAGFHAAVTEAGGVAGGLHLEATPDDVTECVTAATRPGDAQEKYTSLCDPRLNPQQALRVASAWPA